MSARARLLLVALVTAVAGSLTGVTVASSTGAAEVAGGPWCCLLPVDLP